MSSLIFAFLGDYFLGSAWILIGLVSMLLFGYAIHEHRELWTVVKTSNGAEKRWAISKLFFVWLLPVLSSLATFAAQAESDKDEKRISELERQNVPRSLSPEQSAGITRELSQELPKNTVFFMLDADAEDGAAFGNSIANALWSAGYSIYPRPARVTSGLSRGVRVSMTDPSQGARILKALTANGVRASSASPDMAMIGVFPHDVPPNAITIMIGKKDFENQ